MTIKVQDNTKDATQPNSLHEDFGRLYVATRRKENRLYTNEEVRQLPHLPASHILYKEWQVRKRSTTQLINYLNKKKKQSLRILEVGCGNGWLSASLATVPNADVIGIDINSIELKQAKEVFKELPNIHFINTPIDGDALKQQTFDVIVFAASIQYFASINKVLNSAQSLLTTNGEIHIIDSHFYGISEINNAKKRTEEYYTSIGLPEMSIYYYHHSLTDFSNFSYTVLYKPSRIQRIIFRNHHPFYWIKIKGKD